MKHPPLRILSLDPGTTFVGLAISDIVDNKLIVQHACSLNVANVEKTRFNGGYPYGHRACSLKIIYDFISSMLVTWGASVVASEVPYLRLSLSAFISLYDCNQISKKAILDHSSGVPFVGFDPASAKTDIGLAKGNDGDKSLVKKAVIGCTNIDLSNIFIHQLDQHAIDAILIAHAYYIRHVKGRVP